MAERDVWSFYESLGSGDRSHLTNVEQEVAAICDLRQEVNSGGFDAYFRFWGGNTAEAAASAIGRILGNDWADVLLDAMALLGPVYPRTANEREAILSEAVSEALEVFDARYFDLEASVDADGLLTAELRRN